MPKKQRENPLMEPIKETDVTLLSARVPTALYWKAKALLPTNVRQNAQSLGNYALWYLVEHKKGN